VLRANAFNSSAKRRTATTHLLQDPATSGLRQPEGGHAVQNGGLDGQIQEESSSSGKGLCISVPPPLSWRDSSITTHLAAIFWRL